MPNEIQALYGRLRELPFPALGKQIGEFPLYDGLVAGCADRASRGETVSAAEVPGPDTETLRYVSEVSDRGASGKEELAFIEYFNLLEDVRRALNRIAVS
jgi:hypothetical protein